MAGKPKATEGLYFRCAPEDAEAFREAASEAKMSLSAFLRAAAWAAVRSKHLEPQCEAVDSHGGRCCLGDGHGGAHMALDMRPAVAHLWEGADG